MKIVIDGPAGTGKSTIAQQVAKDLGFLFLDTGAMYRAVTYGIIKHGIASDDSDAIARYLSNFDLTIDRDNTDPRYFLEGEEITSLIRSPEITAQVGLISAHPIVRQHIVPIQRKLVISKNVVAEGRDLGTVVFPDAEVKIFLTATADVRAKRRLLQMTGSIDQSEKELQATKQAIELRDRIDSERKHSPLRQAEDAILLDTSDLKIDAVVSKILALIPDP